MAKPVFSSFYYDRDVHRVQSVGNLKALEGQPVLNAHECGKLQARGQQAAVDWIH